MKRLLFLLALTACFFSCQDMGEDLTLGHADQGVPATKSVSISEIAEIDEVYTYKCLDDPDIWRKLGSLEERFEAFQIPDSVLTRMTTSALVKTVLHYPLNALLFAYNNPEVWIRRVVASSSLHRELIKRDDCFTFLVDAYANTDLHMNFTLQRMEWNDVGYADELFLEYFLYYLLKQDTYLDSDCRRLRDVIKEKEVLKAAKPEIFSSYSMQMLGSLASKSVNIDSLSTKSVSVVSDASAVVYTPFGRSVNGYRYTELSSAEITSITNYWTSLYPNATMIRPASRKYNCHSYAWHSTSIDNDVWIGEYYQVSKYWTDDLFISCSSAEAEKIFYYAAPIFDYDGDGYVTENDGSHHSAIPSSTPGKYISKWGQAPLMEHDPTYCPYDSSNLRYYKERPTPVNVSISGPSIVEVGGEYLYQTSPAVPITWNINTALSRPDEYNYHIQGEGSACVLVVKQSGGFTMSGNDIYYNGRLMCRLPSITIVTNDLLKTSKAIEQLEDENTEDMPVSL